MDKTSADSGGAIHTSTANKETSTGGVSTITGSPSGRQLTSMAQSVCLALDELHPDQAHFNQAFLIRGSIETEQMELRNLK